MRTQSSPVVSVNRHGSITVGGAARLSPRRNYGEPYRALRLGESSVPPPPPSTRTTYNNPIAVYGSPPGILAYSGPATLDGGLRAADSSLLRLNREFGLTPTTRRPNSPLHDYGGGQATMAAESARLKDLISTTSAAADAAAANASLRAKNAELMAQLCSFRNEMGEVFTSMKVEGAQAIRLAVAEVEGTHHAQIYDLKGQLDAQQRTTNGIAMRASQSGSRIAEENRVLLGRVAEQSSLMAELTEQAQYLKSNFDGAGKRWAQEADEMRHALAGKDREVMALREGLESQAAQVANLRGTLEESETRCEGLQRARLSEVAALREAVSQRESEVQRLEQGLANVPSPQRAAQASMQQAQQARVQAQAQALTATRGQYARYAGGQPSTPSAKYASSSSASATASMTSWLGSPLQPPTLAPLHHAMVNDGSTMTLEATALAVAAAGETHKAIEGRLAAESAMLREQLASTRASLQEAEDRALQTKALSVASARAMRVDFDRQLASALAEQRAMSSTLADRQRTAGKVIATQIAAQREDALRVDFDRQLASALAEQRAMSSALAREQRSAEEHAATEAERTVVEKMIATHRIETAAAVEGAVVQALADQRTLFERERVAASTLGETYEAAQRELTEIRDASEMQAKVGAARMETAAKQGAAMHAQCDEANAEVEQSRIDMAVLQANVTRLRAELEATVAEHEAALGADFRGHAAALERVEQQHVVELDAQRARHEKALTAAGTMRAAREEELGRVQQQLRDHELAKDVATAEFAVQLQSALAEQRGTLEVAREDEIVSALLERTTALRASATEAATEAAEARGSAEALERDLDGLRASVASEREESARAIDKAAEDAQASVAEARVSVTSLQAQLVMLRQKNAVQDALKAKNASLKTEMSEELTVAKESAAAAAVDATKARASAAALQGQIEVLRSDFGAEKAVEAALVLHESALQKEVGQLQRAAEAASKSAAEELSAAQKSRESVVAAKDVELDTAATALAALNTKLDEEIAELADARAEIAAATETESQLQSALSESQASVAALEVKLAANVDTGAAALESSSARLATNADDARAATAALEQQLASLQSDLDAEKAAGEELLTQKITLQNSVDELGRAASAAAKVAADELSAAKTNAAAVVAAKDAELADALQLADAEVDELKRAAGVAANTASEELRAANESAAAAAADAEALVSASNAGSSEQVEQMKAALHRAEAAHAAAEGELRAAFATEKDAALASAEMSHAAAQEDLKTALAAEKDAALAAAATKLEGVQSRAAKAESISRKSTDMLEESVRQELHDTRSASQKAHLQCAVVVRAGKLELDGAVARAAAAQAAAAASARALEEQQEAAVAAAAALTATGKAELAKLKAVHADAMTQLNVEHQAQLEKQEQLHLAEAAAGTKSPRTPGAASLTLAKQERSHAQEMGRIKARAAEQVAALTTELADATESHAADVRRLSKRQPASTTTVDDFFDDDNKEVTEAAPTQSPGTPKPTTSLGGDEVAAKAPRTPKPPPMLPTPPTPPTTPMTVGDEVAANAPPRAPKPPPTPPPLPPPIPPPMSPTAFKNDSIIVPLPPTDDAAATAAVKADATEEEEEEAAEEERHLVPHTVTELELLAKISGELRDVDFTVIFHAMRAETSVGPSTERMISRHQFIDALATVTAVRMDDCAELLFDAIASTAGLLFAPQAIAYHAVVAAFSVATSADVDVVTAIVFDSHDEIGNGDLTLGEMTKYLKVALAYRLLFTTPPRTAEIETDAHRKELQEAHAKHAKRSGALAEALAKRTFDEIDKDHSHGISKDEFEQWLSDLSGTPRKPKVAAVANDAVAAVAATDAVEAAAAAARGTMATDDASVKEETGAAAVSMTVIQKKEQEAKELEAPPVKLIVAGHTGAQAVYMGTYTLMMDTSSPASGTYTMKDTCPCYKCEETEKFLFRADDDHYWRFGTKVRRLCFCFCFCSSTVRLTPHTLSLSLSLSLF